MSADRVRSTKLKFKGEKTKKKRKHEDDEEEGSSSRRKRKEEDDESPETWVLPENPNEIRGPTFVMHPSDPSPICINYDSTRGRIVLHSFPTCLLDAITRPDLHALKMLQPLNPIQRDKRLILDDVITWRF